MGKQKSCSTRSLIQIVTTARNHTDRGSRGMLGLADYSSSDSEEAPLPGPELPAARADGASGVGASGSAAAAAAAAAALVDEGEDDDDDDDDEQLEQQEEEEPEPELHAPAPAVVPLALTAAEEESADDDDDDDERPLQCAEPPPPDSVDALPPPDFSDWDPDGTAPVRATVPKVTALGKRQRGGPAGPHQVSSGFKASVTKHDLLVAQKAREFEESVEARRANGGFSSAYDSVFRAPEGDAVDRNGKAIRSRVNSKGKVVRLSKKEQQREDALEASLRG